MHTHTHTKAQFNGCTPARFPSSPSVCSFTPPHGFTKKMTVKEEGWRLPLQLTLTLIPCQSSAHGEAKGGREEGVSAHFWGEGSAVSQNCAALISLLLSFPAFSLSLSLYYPPLFMINQTHRPLWSVVSCYLVTSCRDLPGPLVFPWRLCPFCRLLAASRLRCPDGL